MQVRCCNELYSPMKQCLKLFSFRLGAVEQDSQHSCNGTKLHGPRDSWKTKCCMSPSTLDPTQEWRSMALNICCPSTGTSCGGPEDPGKKWGYQIVVFVSPCDSGIPIWINTEPPHQWRQSWKKYVDVSFIWQLRPRPTRINTYHHNKSNNFFQLLMDSAYVSKIKHCNGLHKWFFKCSRRTPSI